MSLKIRFALSQAAQQSGLPPEQILAFVSKTWVIPVEVEPQIFDEEDIARIRLIHELQENLGVNDEAVPVIMHLIDQLNRLHLELRRR
jgi:chaperone modulatory protein CbpM